MHSATFGVHLEREIPKVRVKKFSNFYTVDITFEKSTIKFFIDTEQELVNFKNNFLWAFEKPSIE